MSSREPLPNFLSPQPLATTDLFLVFMDLPVPGISCGWNHTMCYLSCLLSLAAPHLTCLSHLLAFDVILISLPLRLLLPLFLPKVDNVGVSRGSALSLLILQTHRRCSDLLL